MSHDFRPLGPAESIPVFNCEVLIGPDPKDETKVRARVANLDGLSVTSDSEVAALKQLVGMFKQRVAQLTAAGEPIPWREPKRPAESWEQTRLIALHL